MKTERPKRLAGRTKASTSPRRYGLEIFLWTGVVLMISGGLAYWVGTSRQTNHIESRLKRWRVVYELSDRQIEQLRAIETAFHGSGNPFAPPRPTAAEKKAHRDEIAAVLPPAAAKRFLSPTTSTASATDEQH